MQGVLHVFMQRSRALIQVLDNFPATRFAFAYGSGIFEQPGLYRHRSPRLLDFIFAVDDPFEWHTQAGQLLARVCNT